MSMYYINHLSDGAHMTILFPLTKRHHATRIAMLTVKKYSGIFKAACDGGDFADHPPMAIP